MVIPARPTKEARASPPASHPTSPPEESEEVAQQLLELGAGLPGRLEYAEVDTEAIAALDNEQAATHSVVPPAGMLSGYLGDEGSPTAGAEDYPDTPDSAVSDTAQVGAGYVTGPWPWSSSDSEDE